MFQGFTALNSAVCGMTPSSLIASLLGSEFSSETILQVQRDFLAILAMHFKASRPTIKLNKTQSFAISNSLHSTQPHKFTQLCKFTTLQVYTALTHADSSVQSRRFTHFPC